MSLKQIIRKKKILKLIADSEMTLPGEPMIYSIKLPVGKRILTGQHFRNKKFSSIIRCHFTSYYLTHTPVVLIVKFYVSPPEKVKISKYMLKHEKQMASHTYEICDYLLSFMEMLLHALIGSYRQIVKVDAEKIYSDNPRTVFKFMSWEAYAKFEAKNTNNTEAKSINTLEQVGSIQPEQQRHETSHAISNKSSRRRQSQVIPRPPIGSCTFRNTSA